MTEQPNYKIPSLSIKVMITPHGNTHREFHFLQRDQRQLGNKARHECLVIVPATQAIEVNRLKLAILTDIDVVAKLA
jgi:hypothetical protein